MPGAINQPSATFLRPRARGALDLFAPADDGTVMLGGWLLHPDHVLDGATVFIDEIEVGTGALFRRDDLAGLWPHLPSTQHTGFNVRGPLPAPAGDVRTITVAGTRAGRTVVVHRTHRRVEPATFIAPHPELLMRVSGNRDPAAFAQIGLDATMDLMRAVDRNRGLANVRRILDWGCGPGRISAQLASLFPRIELAGCDLDAEAIAWCNQHLRAGAFHATNPLPPLPFPDQSFDAVVAVSVMTHLAWPVQRKWLVEMRRLLRPGGVLAASVHGPFAASFFPGRREYLHARGFVAEAKDKSLRRIAPRGYYRGAFQTPEFTREHWAVELEVADYLEAGLAGLQDLVVARRRS